MSLSLLMILIFLSMLIFETAPVRAVPLQPHSPIFIDGDKSFTIANGVGGGSGTLLNPYLIQNWNVTSPSGTAVDIRNTTAYFVIRDVFVGWSQYGMFFRNVTNADVENSTLFKNQYGLNLVSSSDAIIFNNNFVNNTVLQASDTGGFQNSWDNGYYSPSGGGNYWSDYTGIDNCSGLSQNNCPAPDGIGDTWYRIGPSSTFDYYPLMRPFIPDMTPPGWPSGSKLSAFRITPTSLTLDWTNATDNVGVVSYTVYEGSMIKANVTVNAHELNVTGLKPDSTYTFKVEAADRTNNLSDNGPSLTITTPTPVLSIFTLEFWLRNLYFVLAAAAIVVSAVLVIVFRMRKATSPVAPSEAGTRVPSRLNTVPESAKLQSGMVRGYWRQRANYLVS